MERPVNYSIEFTEIYRGKYIFVIHRKIKAQRVCARDSGLHGVQIFLLSAGRCSRSEYMSRVGVYSSRSSVGHGIMAHGMNDPASLELVQRFPHAVDCF